MWDLSQCSHSSTDIQAVYTQRAHIPERQHIVRLTPRNATIRSDHVSVDNDEYASCYRLIEIVCLAVRISSSVCDA